MYNGVVQPLSDYMGYHDVYIYIDKTHIQCNKMMFGGGAFCRQSHRLMFEDFGDGSISIQPDFLGNEHVELTLQKSFPMAVDNSPCFPNNPFIVWGIVHCHGNDSRRV